MLLLLVRSERLIDSNLIDIDKLLLKIKNKCSVFDNHREPFSKKRQNFNSRALSMEVDVGLVPFAFTKIVLVVSGWVFFGKFNQSGP